MERPREEDRERRRDRHSGYGRDRRRENIRHRSRSSSPSRRRERDGGFSRRRSYSRDEDEQQRGYKRFRGDGRGGSQRSNNYAGDRGSQYPRYRERGNSRNGDFDVDRRRSRFHSPDDVKSNHTGRGRGRNREVNGEGNRKDFIIPFEAWVEQNQVKLESSKNTPEQDYKSYVEQWVKQLENRFFSEHQSEEWFRDRYSFQRLMENRKKRSDYVKSQSKHLMKQLEDLKNEEAENYEALKEKFVQRFPSLDCPPDLQPRKDRGRMPTTSEPFKAIGEDYPAHMVVHVPKIAAKVSSDMLMSAISKEMEKYEGPGEKTFELYLNDPCSTVGFREKTVFNRCGWIICSHQNEAEYLEGKTLSVAISEDDKESTVQIRLMKQRRFPNRKLHSEFSDPLRVSHDLDQALSLAESLDKHEGLSSESSGIGVFLSSMAAKAIIQEAEAKTSTLLHIPEEHSARIKKADQEYNAKKRRLDLVLGYLRHVHLLCYYSHTQFRDKGDLLHGGLLPRVRLPLSEKALVARYLNKEAVDGPPLEGNDSAEKVEDGSKRDDQPAEDDATKGPKTWKVNALKGVDEGIGNIVNRLSEDAVTERKNQRVQDMERAESLKKAAVESFCEAETKEEAENRFRCMLPPYKLFRAKKFVFKHILSKHPERIQKVGEEAMQVLDREIFERDDRKPLQDVEYWLQVGLGKKDPPGDGRGSRNSRADSGRQFNRARDHHLDPDRRPRGPPHKFDSGLDPRRGPRGPPRGHPMSQPSHFPRGPPMGMGRGPPMGGPRNFRPRGNPDRYIPGPAFPRGAPLHNERHPHGEVGRDGSNQEGPSQPQYRTVVDYSDL